MAARPFRGRLWEVKPLWEGSYFLTAPSPLLSVSSPLIDIVVSRQFYFITQLRKQVGVATHYYEQHFGSIKNDYHHESSIRKTSCCFFLNPASNFVLKNGIYAPYTHVQRLQPKNWLLAFIFY